MFTGNVVNLFTSSLVNSSTSFHLHVIKLFTHV
nr:MAG TPA: hypothetical protein [Caudoviricetes sp.]